MNLGMGKAGYVHTLPNDRFNCIGGRAQGVTKLRSQVTWKETKGWRRRLWRYAYINSYARPTGRRASLPLLCCVTCVPRERCHARGGEIKVAKSLNKTKTDKMTTHHPVDNWFSYLPLFEPIIIEHVICRAGTSHSVRSQRSIGHPSRPNTLLYPFASRHLPAPEHERTTAQGTSQAFSRGRRGGRRHERHMQAWAAGAKAGRDLMPADWKQKYPRGPFEFSDHRLKTEDEDDHRLKIERDIQIQMGHNNRWN
jgi:hypothetical protein